jgi:hypothetical protein
VLHVFRIVNPARNAKQARLELVLMSFRITTNTFASGLTVIRVHVLLQPDSDDFFGLMPLFFEVKTFSA